MILREVAENIACGMGVNPYKIYFVFEDNDIDSIEAGTKLIGDFPVRVLTSPYRNPNAAVNLGFTFTTEPFVCNATDDLKFTPGWWECVLHHFEDPKIQVVAAWDGWFDRGKSMYTMRREYITDHGTIDEPGKIFHPGYRHVYADTEFLNTALYRNVFSYCREALVQHCSVTSPFPRIKEYDKTFYHLASLNKHDDHDGKLYEERKKLFKGADRLDIPFE